MVQAIKQQKKQDDNINYYSPVSEPVLREAMCLIVWWKHRYNPQRGVGGSSTGSENLQIKQYLERPFRYCKVRSALNNRQSVLSLNVGRSKRCERCY